MKKSLLIALITVLISANVTAQVADSVLLSVFNTGDKYRLTPATFSPRTPQEELLTEMVMATDTINVVSTETDSSGRSVRRETVVHRCDKALNQVQSKVVLLSLGSCDATLMCLNAQRAGAKAVVLIHRANNRDSILLTGGAFADSIRIPCYTVRRDIGARMQALLPSQVGIKKPDVMPDDAQYLKQNTQNQGNSKPSTAKDSTKTGQNTEGVIGVPKTENAPQNSDVVAKSIVDISPNPANDVAYLTFNFSEIGDLTIVVDNAAGQTIFTKILRGVQKGTFDMPINNWANGIYSVEVKHAKKTFAKKLVVQR